MELDDFDTHNTHSSSLSDDTVSLYLDEWYHSGWGSYQGDVFNRLIRKLRTIIVSCHLRPAHPFLGHHGLAEAQNYKCPHPPLKLSLNTESLWYREDAAGK